MQKFLRLYFLVALAATPAVFAQQSRNIGDVVYYVDKDKVKIRVSASTPELQNLALVAFGVHGRYKLVSSGYDYDVKFSAVGAAQVRVDVTKGLMATPVASELVTGTSARNALLRAADVAVVKTNDLGLKGFFTAKLAFILERGHTEEIGTSDLFFGEARQITHDNAHALMPRWSPDGAQIIFTSYFKSGSPDIFLVDPATARPTAFVSFRGTNSSARFSPNGQQVAMILSGEGTPEVYLSDPLGRHVTRKTHSDKVKSSPCFSPDGSRLVFAMEPGPQLYVMSASGGPPQPLSTGFTFAAEPDWSRTNPNKIACTVKTGGSYQIAVYDFSKGTAEVVSKAPFDGIEPSWLADGRHLVYTARDRTTSVLCILDTETGQSKRISGTSLGQVQQASVWTP
jgi:TolB protein